VSQVLSEKTTLSKERRGEIAEAVLLNFLMERGIDLGSDLKRELGQLASRLDIPKVELKEFMKSIVEQVADDVFAPSSRD
jgi:hypothetical protein